MRVQRLLLVLAIVASAIVPGCTSLGKGGRSDLAVLQDFAPFEVRLRLTNPSDHALVVEPTQFRLVGSDGFTFAGVASGRDDALGATNLAPGQSVEGWVAFEVEAYAARPMTLVYEADGVRLQATLPAVE